MAGSLTDSYGQGIPYLDYTDKPDQKALGEGIVSNLTPRSIMRFTDATSRGATITAPVAGMVTYLSTEDRYDGYTSGQGWVPLTPGPWNPLPFATGFQAFAGVPGYRLINGTVQLRGQVAKTDSTTFTSNGTTGYTIATLPSGFRPTYYAELAAAQELAGSYTCRMQVGTDGRIIAFVETDGSPHWVGLDGLSFPVT